MRTNVVTTVLLSCVLLLAAGCNARQSLSNIRGLLPRADIPNAGNQQPPDQNPTQSTTNSETPPQTQPQTQAQQTQPSQPATTTTASNTNVLRPSSASKEQPSRTSGAISFTPVIGAPVSAVQPLSRRLGTEARGRGLTILQSASGDSDHILKGYFSAFADGDKTTVAFVWDVLDSQGNRLYRISGQEVAQGTASDPWDVVQEATMETIATRTISDYVSWRSSSGS